jgi:hypothetical protein
MANIQVLDKTNFIDITTQERIYTDQTLYTLTIPANTLVSGKALRITFVLIGESLPALVLGIDGSQLIVNGKFDANLASWVDVDTSGGVSSRVTTPANCLKLNSTTTGTAARRQSISTTIGNTYLFSFKIISSGVVGTTPGATVKVGTTAGGTQIYNIFHTALGVNSFSFTATATTTWVEFARTNLVGFGLIDDVGCQMTFFIPPDTG